MTTIRRYAIGALCAVLLLAIAATCGYCARDRRARQEAAQSQAAAKRASDEAALAASGAIVAERTSREAAQHAAEALADQIAALRRAAPSVEVHEARYGEDQRRQVAVAENEQRRNDARMERLEMKIDRLLERSDGNAR